MKREIKFRGKLACTGQEGDGEWVYGDYCKITGRHYIIPDYADCDWEEEDIWSVQGLLRIDPKTVSQFTGLHDKKGVEIYEGDIVKHERVCIGPDDCAGNPVWDSMEYNRLGHITIRPSCGVTLNGTVESIVWDTGENQSTSRYSGNPGLWGDFAEVIGNIYTDKKGDYE